MAETGKTIRRSGRLALAAALAIFASPAAEARDLSRIENFLVPVFVAQQFGNLCAANDPAYLRATAGAHGSVNDYAERVKHEIARALGAEDIAVVLRGAAGRARETARASLREISAAPTQAQLAAFCYSSVKDRIRAVMTAYDMDNEKFLREVDAALR